MPIYMKYGDFKGTVATKNFAKWIQLESVQFGVNRHITTQVGKGMNRDASPASPSEIVVSKLQDDSSSKLCREAALSSTGRLVDIVITSASVGGESELMRWTLTNTLISSFSCSGHGGEGNPRPHEMLSLNYNKVEVKFVQQAKEGTKGTTPFSTSYDLATLEK